MRKRLFTLALMLVTFTSNAQTTLDGDMNHDGVLNITDVMIIIEKILGNTPKSYLTCPDNNHPHLIDLGLPSGTKWACCNVGSYMPAAFGDYFAWGETEKKSNYSFSTYQHRYVGEDGYWHMQDLGNNIAGTEYDVAHVKWGDHWQMPTQQQMIELVQNSTFEAVENGNKAIGPNGGYIILPGSGWHRGSELVDWGGNGRNSYYWSSTPDSSNDQRAYRLRIDYCNPDISSSDREVGYAVRPVWNP